MTTTTLFVMGAVAILIIGTFTRGLAELLLPAVVPAEGPLLALARLHYLLVGTTIFTIFAAIYLWLSRAEDELPHESAGKLSFWLMFVGFNMAFLPTSAPGRQPPLLLEPARLWYAASAGVQFGVLLLLAGIVLSAWHIRTARRHSRA